MTVAIVTRDASVDGDGWRAVNASLDVLCSKLLWLDAEEQKNSDFSEQKLRWLHVEFECSKARPFSSRIKIVSFGSDTVPLWLKRPLIVPFSINSTSCFKLSNHDVPLLTLNQKFLHVHKRKKAERQR